VTDKQAAAEKQALRSRLRAARRAHVEGLDPRTRVLFRRPPAPLLDLIPANAVIGVYNAGRWEAPQQAMQRSSMKPGTRSPCPGLPRAKRRCSSASGRSPLDEDLEADPWGVKQPPPMRRK
jgi:5-formyltetrahydrofolate cyclo-ligase